MTKIADAGFSPHIGIESIIPAGDGPGGASLPSSAGIVPAETVTGIDALHALYASSWDTDMQTFLRPHISARELFIPGVFAGRLRQARRELQEEARRTKSPALRGAALALEEDEELKGLLDLYRNLLLQG
jgi:hypothetical protein